MEKRILNRNYFGEDVAMALSTLGSQEGLCLERAVDRFNSLVNGIEVNTVSLVIGKDYGFSPNGTFVHNSVIRYKDETLDEWGKTYIMATVETPRGRKAVDALQIEFCTLPWFFKGSTDEENEDRADQLLRAIHSYYTEEYDELERSTKEWEDFLRKTHAEQEAKFASFGVIHHEYWTTQVGYRDHSYLRIEMADPIPREKALQIFEGLGYRMTAKKPLGPYCGEEINLLNSNSCYEYDKPCNIWVRECIPEYTD